MAMRACKLNADMLAKPRTLNQRGAQLPESSSFCNHQVVEGSLLHLVLAPDTGDAKSLAQRSREGQAWLQQACGRTATDSLVARDNARAFGKKNQKKKGKKVNNKSSLYERGGGVFGVAAFVDRCMDAWMADPILNANDAVATWHERAQRCGFKFLVTQLMGYLCGGPQIVSCSKGVWLRVCIGCVNWCVD